MVRVPVLSEQITDVQPKVSTEGKDLTMAFFFAILLVPVLKIFLSGKIECDKYHDCYSIELY